MTKDELLKQIKNTLANPQSWVDAGLGHNTVQKTEAWVDERARNLAAWILPLIPAEVEGWENEETWTVWLDLSNREHVLERAIEWAKKNAMMDLPEGAGGPDRARIAEMLEALYSDRAGAFQMSMCSIALRRVDWMALAEEVVEKVKDGAR